MFDRSVREAIMPFVALAVLTAVAAAPAQAQFLSPRFQRLGAVSVAVEADAGRQAVALADLDGDARPDLVAIDPDNARIGIYRNDGGGGFALVAEPEIGLTPMAVAIADVASPFASDAQGAPDGLPDIIVGGDAGEVRILLGRGDGQVDPAEQDLDDFLETFEVIGLAVGDFDENGALDLALLDAFGVYLVCNEAGTFAPCGAVDGLDVDADDPIEILAGDFDADADLDLAVLDRAAQRVSPLLGRGDASFAIGSPVSVSGEAVGAETVDLAVARLDGDATDDLVAINHTDDLQFIAVSLLGRANGSFRVTRFVVDFQASALAVDDFDPDEENGVDVLVGYEDFGVTVNLGDSAGSFLDPFYPVGSNGVGSVSLLVAVDLDGDARPDIVSINRAGTQATVLLNASTPPCVGDCDANGVVTVDELVTGVNIAIGGFDPRQCLALQVDGSINVAVSELIAAVRASLEGCQAPPA